LVFVSRECKRLLRFGHVRFGNGLCLRVSRIRFSPNNSRNSTSAWSVCCQSMRWSYLTSDQRWRPVRVDPLVS
jgi:hypothetical protein